jgi:hypothetical protein
MPLQLVHTSIYAIVVITKAYTSNCTQHMYMYVYSRRTGKKKKMTNLTRARIQELHPRGTTVFSTAPLPRRTTTAASK